MVVHHNPVAHDFLQRLSEVLRGNPELVLHGLGRVLHPFQEVCECFSARWAQQPAAINYRYLNSVQVGLGEPN